MTRREVGLMAERITACYREVMAKSKRRGADDSQVRSRIVSAASEIINQDGFDAITAPRLAEMIGLRRPIIYYYFDDMDQIRIAAVRYAYDVAKDLALSRLPDGRAAEILWQMFEKVSAPLSELTNYSLRSDAFRMLMAEIIGDLRLTFSVLIGAQAKEDGRLPMLGAAGFAFLIQAVSTALATERRLGLSLGHAEARSFFETTLGIAAARAA